MRDEFINWFVLKHSRSLENKIEENHYYQTNYVFRFNMLCPICLNTYT